MDLMEAIRRRFSVRRYRDKPVEERKLRDILEAGRLAPSASNGQEWRYIVVRDEEKRKRLMKAAHGQAFVAEAPVVIAACAETDNRVMSCGQRAYPINVAISVDHMTLKAVEEGLGTCWIGRFNEAKAKEILDVPEEIRIVELLTLGYPAQAPPGEKDRKALEEIVMYERWTKS
jgi:nitroreductase